MPAKNTLEEFHWLFHLVQSFGLQYFTISPATFFPEFTTLFERWLKNKFHGNMQYLENHSGLKASPIKILPGCGSIILVALPYYQPYPPIQKGQGTISQYAWGRNYHKVLLKKLKSISNELKNKFPDDHFRYGVDSLPLAEKWYGQKAGMGFTGKNSLLIHPSYGSWFFIGEILSTHYFQAPSSKMATSQCGSCQKCIDACPTQALVKPYQLDARKCISYLTVENREEIPEELRKKILMVFLDQIFLKIRKAKNYL